MRNGIHIAVAFDENYLTPFYALATSVLKHNPTGTFFHAIATIKPYQRQRILSYIKERGGDIAFYDVDVSLFDKFSIPLETYFTPAIFYRFLFPSLVGPAVERLLYLDVDIIVDGDLSELFHGTHGSFTLWGVEDNLNSIRKDLGLESTNEYFNSGVLLIDVQRWRNECVSEKCIDFISSFGAPLPYPDQDALNVIFKGQWGQLDRKFNLMLSESEAHVAKPDDAILSEGIVIHFTGVFKPWVVLCNHPLKRLYKKYFEEFSTSSIGVIHTSESFERYFPDQKIESNVRDQQAAILYGYAMHLLWIKALKNAVNAQLFNEVFVEQYGDVAVLNQIIEPARLAVEKQAPLISLLTTEIISSNKSQLIADCSWMERWISDCTQQIGHAQTHRNNAAFQTIPSLINLKLTISDQLRLMLQYAIVNIARVKEGVLGH